jgi:hypothetical protein
VFAVFAREPLRELPWVLEWAFVERVDPLRDCEVRRLDAVDFVRPAPLVDAVPVALARLRGVPAFGDWALVFAEPFLADADFDAVLRERLVVLFELLPVDRFVVAMSPSRLRDPRILR